MPRPPRAGRPGLFCQPLCDYPTRAAEERRVKKTPSNRMAGEEFADPGIHGQQNFSCGRYKQLGDRQARASNERVWDNLIGDFLILVLP